MVYVEEFNEKSGSEAQKRAQADFDDLQNEVAGRDVGRIRRFLTGAQHDPIAIKQRRADEETTLFVALMQNAEFARLYEEAGERLRETRQFLDDAREQLATIRAEIEAQEQDILSRAARLPDGTLVFQGEDGRAYTRDGKLSDHPDAQNIIWRGDHAKLDEIQLADQRRKLLEEAEQKLDTHDAELGGLEDRYQNTDDLKSDDLNDIIKRTEDIKESLDQAFKDLKPQTSNTDASVSLSQGAHQALDIKGLDGI